MHLFDMEHIRIAVPICFVGVLFLVYYYFTIFQLICKAVTEDFI